MAERKARRATGRAGHVLRWAGWLGLVLAGVSELAGGSASVSRAGFIAFAVLGGLGLTLEMLDARAAKRGAGGG